jgi:glycosyltransferase involved in cell wall biosynthesis
MKISLVAPSFYPAVIYGGPIFSTLHTCEELAKLDGVEVFVSTTNANMTTRLDVETDKWQKFGEHFFVKYYNETKIGKFSLSLIFNLWRDIKSADVVHVQYMFSTPTPIALLYAKIFDKPIILSSRGALCFWCLAQGSKFKKIWLQWLLKPLVKNIIWHATADQESKEIKAQFPDAQVFVIPNGIEYDTFQTSNVLSSAEYIQKFAHAIMLVDKIIISMGRLQKKKGFDILIDAFSEVLHSFPNSVLLIAGGDEGEEAALKMQIADLGLGKSVFLVGAIGGQEKIDFLANADLFVLPSHNENFGNVFVESLAAGTPIVASTGTPWQEVESAECGRWVDNTAEATAQAMVEMLGRDREQMRANAKRLAQKYDWKNIAREFKTLFERMLEER